MSASTTTVRAKRPQRRSNVSVAENNANSAPKRRYDSAEANADAAAGDNEVVDEAVANAAEDELNNVVADEPSENNVVAADNKNGATQEKSTILQLIDCIYVSLL